MLINDRHNQIVALLQKEKSISIKRLTSLLFVSEATLRRDLSVMEQKGLLQRYYGGASIVESAAEEASLLVREQKQIKEKRKIAMKCLDFIHEGESYFVDSSSTVTQMLYFLRNYKDLTFITNGLNNAQILANSSEAKVYLPSGIVFTKTNSILGTETVEFLKNFFCSVFFFSCGGISLNEGITEASYEQTLIKRAMMKQSKLHILMADHTKFNKIFLCRTCGFERIDYLITDQVPEAEFMALFTQNNVKVVIA